MPDPVRSCLRVRTFRSSGSRARARIAFIGPRITKVSAFSSAGRVHFVGRGHGTPDRVKVTWFEADSLPSRPPAVFGLVYQTTWRGEAADAQPCMSLRVCKRPDGSRWNRSRRRRNLQRFSRGLAFEPLEDRRLLAVDAAVVPGQALVAAASDLVSSNNAPAVNFQLAHLFTGVANSGTFPDAGLTLVGSTFYGTTEGGGLNDSGTVFSINTDGSNFQVLHTFTGSATDGAFPYAGLTVIGSTLYGTTHNAGSASDGVFFPSTRPARISSCCIRSRAVRRTVPSLIPAYGGWYDALWHEQQRRHGQ